MLRRNRCTTRLDSRQIQQEICSRKSPLPNCTILARSSRSVFRMMAFDRTPSRPNLEPETLAALTSALSVSVQRGNHSDDLRDLLYTTAREARDKGIQAERLLLIMKEIWYSLPAVSN